MHQRNEIWHHALKKSRETGVLTAMDICEELDIEDESVVHDVLQELCKHDWLVKSGPVYYISAPMGVTVSPSLPHL